jgi:predicted RNA binding protein YcfA (HicA-like mRNA interferase family)
MRDAKPRQIINALKSFGFTEVSNNKHLKMVKETAMVLVPIHGIIKRNTVDQIRKMAGIDKKEFYGKL